MDPRYHANPRVRVNFESETRISVTEQQAKEWRQKIGEQVLLAISIQTRTYMYTVKTVVGSTHQKWWVQLVPEKPPLCGGLSPPPLHGGLKTPLFGGLNPPHISTYFSVQLGA